MARNIKASELTGLSIYQLENRTVYSSLFMKKKGYLINDNNANEYYSYSLRLFESVFAFITVILITGDNYLLAIGAGLIIYTVITALFHAKFLKKLPVLNNFEKPKKDNYIISTAKEIGYGRLFLVIGLCILTSFIAFYSLATNQFKQLKTNLYYGVGILSAIFALINTASLIVKYRKKL